MLKYCSPKTFCQSHRFGALLILALSLLVFDEITLHTWFGFKHTLHVAGVSFPGLWSHTGQTKKVVASHNIVLVILIKEIADSPNSFNIQSPFFAVARSHN